MKYLLPKILIVLFLFQLSSCKKDDDADLKEKERLEQERLEQEQKEKEEKEAKTVKDVIPEFYPKNYAINYGQDAPQLVLIADQSQGIQGANDLEFMPPQDSRKHELWVLSPGTDRDGGITYLIHDAGLGSQNVEPIRDGNAWHFMALATGIAFGDNGNFATSQGILDANRQGGTFTGPSLWSTDLSIYGKIGKPAQPLVNGSHLDMLHQSPFGMGIAHEKDNIYWVFDGHFGSLVRYDFAEPHYPGGYDHSDGRIWRHSEPDIQKDQGNLIPSHLELDKETGWLYVASTGNNLVLKMDINSGTAMASPNTPVINGEALAYYADMENTTWQIVASEFNKPSGLTLSGERLFISNYETGEIICLNKNSGEELGRIETKGKGITGMCIGPEGKLWFTNALQNAVYRLDPVPSDLP